MALFVALPIFCCYNFSITNLDAFLGIVDYCERYGDSITAVAEEQHKAGVRKFKGSKTASTIDKALRESYPSSKLNVRECTECI